METKIVCPHCGKELVITVTESKQAPQPTPSPQTNGRIGFRNLLEIFNSILIDRRYNAVKSSMKVYGYLSWAYDFASRCYGGNEWMFRADTYPLLYDYRGSDMSDSETAYNGMQAWLMASILAELVPDSGLNDNTQSDLFAKAYEIGGFGDFPLYNVKAFKADPYAMREAASVMYAVCRGDGDISAQIDTYRAELGGKPIPASAWEGLGYRNSMLTDEQGRRGYQTDYLGYCIDTRRFIPDAPGPRVPGTTVCDLPWPWEQGQPHGLFNPDTGNYIKDEEIYQYFVSNYDMMSQTPLSVWNSYSHKKQNRMINVAAIPPCTFIYMFGKKNVCFDGSRHKAYGKNHAYDYYCFSEVSEDTGLALDGPFSDLQGIYRYNTYGDRERLIDTVATILDNFRFPTQDLNYGRCRPGCKVLRTIKSVNPTPGAAENEVYNVDLCAIVADNAAMKVRTLSEDGFAADSPRSYVSGHSAQIWGLALMLTQMENEGNCETWIRKAFEYSVNRSVGRFHWNSDCVYGRLFGAMALPIINAMSGLNLNPVRDYVLNPTPQPVPTVDWGATVIVKNMTGRDIQSTGEVRLYVEGHEGVNVYTPNAVEVGAAVTFPAGDECAYETNCVGNGFTLDDAYDGKRITECRFYDYRHYNNVDAGYSFTLDTQDQRCSSAIYKRGATYVLKIE